MHYGARRNTTDLVALDLYLPDMDGLDVVKRRPQLVSLVFDSLRTRFRTKAWPCDADRQSGQVELLKRIGRKVGMRL
jgi:hypothetical protein